MTELTYRLEPNHLAAYRRLAWDHALYTRDGGADWAWWFFGLPFTAALVLAVCDQAFPLVTGRPFAYTEFFAGFVLGYLTFYAISLLRYRRYVRLTTKPDGLTMGERRVQLTPDGLRSVSKLADGLYRWPCFIGLQVHDDIIVLWMEVGAGLVVPRSVFASPGQETDFINAVQGFLRTPGSASEV